MPRPGACLISGFLQYFLLAGDLARHGGLPRFARPKLDEDIRAFFRALGPATIGSMGTQVALFADTIIATFLPAGALSALYYADRLNQLPIGVIGIAIGTVLLPEMSRRLTAEDHAGALAAQRRAFDFTLLFSVPFVTAFLTVPDVIMRAMFARGAFSKGDAAAAGATLAAYAVGLIPFVLIRSAVATFYARKDTATPVKAALTGVAVNVGLKIRAGGLAGAGRSCLCDRGRRLDQFIAGDRLCGAGRLSSISIAHGCDRWRSLSLPPPCWAPRFGWPRGSQGHSFPA